MGDAAIIGYAELRPQRNPERRRFSIEQWAELTRIALADAGVALGEVNGIVTPAVRESSMFVPATGAGALPAGDLTLERRASSGSETTAHSAGRL